MSAYVRGKLLRGCCICRFIKAQIYRRSRWPKIGCNACDKSWGGNLNAKIFHDMLSGIMAGVAGDIVRLLAMFLRERLKLIECEADSVAYYLFCILASIQAEELIISSVPLIPSFRGLSFSLFVSALLVPLQV
jgi:hypothetical protein